MKWVVLIGVGLLVGCLYACLFLAVIGFFPLSPFFFSSSIDVAFKSDASRLFNLPLLSFSQKVQFMFVQHSEISYLAGTFFILSLFYPILSLFVLVRQ